MSNYIRAKFSGGLYFFTRVTYNRRPFLTSPLARKTLRFAWRDVQSRYPFEVEAICLLPDHLHCIWRLPENDADFSKRWMSIKAIFTKTYLSSGGQDGRRNPSRKKTGEAAIWQRRFWEHLIRDDSDYARHFDTIHYNPVKPEHVSIKNSPAGPQESQFLTLNEMDKRYIKTVFKQTGYRKKQTAKILGIGLNTLKRKLTEISCYS